MSTFRNIETDVEYSNTPGRLRPGWLADDNQWRHQLSALTEEDRAMLAEQWEAAGGNPPALDMSWLQTEEIGGGPPDWVLIVVLVVVVLGAATGWVWFA